MAATHIFEEHDKGVEVVERGAAQNPECRDIVKAAQHKMQGKVGAAKKAATKAKLQQRPAGEDQARLEECEAVLRKNKEATIECANALETIRREKLYKAKDASLTFETYCRKFWGFGKNWGNKLARAGSAHKQLVAAGIKSPTTDPALLVDLAAICKKLSGTKLVAAYQDLEEAGFDNRKKIGPKLDVLLGRQRRHIKTVKWSAVVPLAEMLADLLPKLEGHSATDADIRQLRVEVDQILSLLNVKPKEPASLQQNPRIQVQAALAATA